MAAFIVLLISLVDLAVAEESTHVPARRDSVSFNDDIRPLLNARCTACHGGVKQAGGVSFVTMDSMLPPDGWLVEPGNPHDSVLFERITSHDPDTVMPPPDHGKPLDQNEVDLIRDWIWQGAPWSDHWSFELPQSQPLPSIQQTDWTRNSLDNFVLAQLESEGITPAEDEAPHRWLRRVTLDLTGLPPTPQETAQFRDELQANTTTTPDRAYERVVDRLLHSAHFGERWASVWLDQIRYADSKGLGLDGPRNVWKYRDWVISAFNRDVPFDQFTIKQIAGDLLPDATVEDKIASAANRLTQSNEEGGTDDEEFRVAAVIDRVSTTMQTWQGLTIGCVQCHSHPYDPITHEEFYQLTAFFNNTADSDLDEDWPTMAAPIREDDYDAATEMDQQIDRLRTDIWQREFKLLSDPSVWQPLIGLEASTNNKTRVAVERVGNHDEFHTEGTVSRSTDFVLEAPIPKKIRRLTAIRLTAMPLDPPKAVPDSEWGFVLSHVEAALIIPGVDEPQPIRIERLIIDEPEPFYDPQASLDPRSNQGFAAYSRIHYPRQAALVLAKPIEIPENARVQIKLAHRVMILASFPLITRRGHLALSDDDRLTELVTGDPMVAMRRQLIELKQRRKQIPSTALPVMAERPAHLKRPTHLFIRGLFLTKGQSVSANVPSLFSPLPGDVPADRLALARWLVSPENPLTARVTVNRFWARLFGVGLVATEEDFGSSGDPPSHPTLLDDLAWRFQHEMKWSVKSLLREITLSRTYRQSSRIRPELIGRDPENRLLARGPRRRLSAEEVRDEALAVSGLLSRSVYGSPVHPPIPDGVWKPFASWDKWDTPHPDDPERYRRSIYTYTKRSIPYPMFAAFDAPSREFCTPRRLQSNTPLQSLMSLNDQSFIEFADGLAKRMKQSAARLDDQLAYGFQLVTNRMPREPELQELRKLHSQRPTNSANPSSGTDEGLRHVASLLLNLDEFLTK